MKTCRYCGLPKPESDFEVANTIKGTVYRRLKCRRCKQDHQNKRRAALKKWLIEYKKTISCQNCGNSDYRVLQFHHLDPAQKDFSVGDLLSAGCSRERILREVHKCEVLCANCHRIVHWHEEEE